MTSVGTNTRSISVPIGAGIIAGGISLAMSGMQSVNVLGSSIPAPLAYALVVASASGATEMLKSSLIPLVTTDRTGTVAISILQPAITGASTAVLGMAVSGFRPDLSLNNALLGAFLTGFISQIGGNYIGDSVQGVIDNLMPKSKISTVF